MVPCTSPFDPVMISTVALEGGISTTPVTLIASDCPVVHFARISASTASGSNSPISAQSAFLDSVGTEMDRGCPRCFLSWSTSGEIPGLETPLSEAKFPSLSVFVSPVLIEGPESSEST